MYQGKPVRALADEDARGDAACGKRFGRLVSRLRGQYELKM